MNTEPALIIGLVASVVVGVAEQITSSGLVSNAGAVSLLGLVVTIVPLIAGAIIRGFVTPAPAAKA